MSNIICCIAKYENDYINDWINYHLSLGFDHIYIYDNNPVTYEPIENRIDQLDKVTIFKVPDRVVKNIQKYHYNNFYQEYKNTFDWCAYIDCDEFIHLGKWKDIKTFLNDPLFHNHNVIRLNMLTYGDDGLIDRDRSIPIYKGITKRINNPHFDLGGKTLIRGHLHNVLIDSAHWPYINGDVAENQIMADGTIGKWKITLPKETDIAHIKHYRTKTLSEFIDQKFNEIVEFEFL